MVVSLANGLYRFAVRMSVGALVGLRIVGIAMEIPAGDIVNEAVVIFVLAVAERDDQILRRDSARLRMEQRMPDARIVRVVVDREHAIAVEVVVLVRLQTARRMTGHRRAGRIFRSGKLAAIEISLAPNIL